MRARASLAAFFTISAGLTNVCVHRCFRTTCKFNHEGAGQAAMPLGFGGMHSGGQEVCHDFRMGRCLRASCRFLHTGETAAPVPAPVAVAAVTSGGPVQPSPGDWYCSASNCATLNYASKSEARRAACLQLLQ